MSARDAFEKWIRDSAPWLLEFASIGLDNLAPYDPFVAGYQAGLEAAAKVCKCRNGCAVSCCADNCLEEINKLKEEGQ